MLSLGEVGLSLAEKKGKEDKKGRERLSKKHAEGLEKDDKGNFTEHDDIFFCLKSYILIDDELLYTKCSLIYWWCGSAYTKEPDPGGYAGLVLSNKN